MTTALTIAVALALVAFAIVLFRLRSANKHRLLNEYITDKIPSGLITVNRRGEIIGHNPASERIFAGRLSTAPSFRDLVRESDHLQSLLDRCLSAGEVFTRVEFNTPVEPQGDKRIGINLSPITNVRGDIEGAICLLSDLEEIVELQNQVKLKENFAVLGEMSAGIAHEFKNSIATILGYAQMSSFETDVNSLRDYAREIQKESQALSIVVTDFLNFARPVNASINEVDLNALLETVIADLKNLRPGNYALNFQADVPAIVMCDSTLMRQSFLNLLINAVEALEESGRISVRVEQARERDHNQVRIAVEDNGRGIPAHQMSKIFFPFFTTKPHGTGLGLSLVQKIVIAHNGKIEAQNAESGGTRFVVTLPISENQTDSVIRMQ